MLDQWPLVCGPILQVAFLFSFSYLFCKIKKKCKNVKVNKNYPMNKFNIHSTTTRLHRMRSCINSPNKKKYLKAWTIIKKLLLKICTAILANYFLKVCANYSPFHCPLFSAALWYNPICMAGNFIVYSLLGIVIHEIVIRNGELQ